MLTELASIRQSLSRLASTFEPSRVTVADAARIRDEWARIERVAAAQVAQSAARAAQSGAWRSNGARSAAHELAAATGTSVGEAVRMLDTGRRLEVLPDVAAAAAAGELSAAKLAEVTDTAVKAPRATRELLEVARAGSLGELQEECRRVKATAVDDAEARRDRAHTRRALRGWTDRDGVGHLHLSDAPEVTAEVLAAVRAEVTRTRRPADTTREEALGADALVSLATGASGGARHPDPATAPRDARRSRSVDAKILVRVDFDALLRGYPTAGEVCEVAGLGPVAVSAVTDMIASGDPFLAAIATRGQQVYGVAHLGRRPTALQDSALEWLYPLCAREGCHRSTRLERDHRVPWAQSKVTLVDLMDRLCEDDHALRTHRQWALVDGTGKRPLVPPDDPRHPRHTVGAQATPRPPPR